MSDILSLSDIFAREVAVEWFEAVALVREVVDRVVQNLGGRSVPDLDQIDLTSEGRVRLSGATETGEPVRRLGQLLQAVLVQSDPPVQLRLTASQATAPTPAFATIREFDEALAYYERPDRERILQELFARADDAPRAIGVRTPTLDEIVPLEHEEAKRPGVTTPEQRRLRRRAIPLAAGAAVVVVCTAACWQYWVAAPPEMGVAKLATRASDAVGDAMVAGVSKVSEAAGLGRLAPADSPSVPASPVPPSAKATATSGSERSGKRQEPALRVFDLSPSVSAALAAEVPTETTSVVVFAEPEHPDPSDATVYSPANAEVTPPIGVRPQLPAALPADISKDQLGRIELTILSDGTVGAVKLLGGRRSVLEAMLLSAAKAWTFTPAMKDGHPVAYKKTVWLALR